MGTLIEGNLNISLFNVVGADVDIDFWNSVAALVNELSFSDIDDNYEEGSVGWVNMWDMFDNELSPEKIIPADGLIVMRMRFDERKVPVAALKKFIAKEERRIMKEKEIPKLARSLRMEIKERITAEMTRKAPPVPTCVDMVWNLEEETVYLLTTTPKTIEMFETLFKETFGLDVMQKVPYTMAQHILGGDDIIKDLQPSTLL